MLTSLLFFLPFSFSRQRLWEHPKGTDDVNLAPIKCSLVSNIGATSWLDGCLCGGVVGTWQETQSKPLKFSLRLCHSFLLIMQSSDHCLPRLLPLCLKTSQFSFFFHGLKGLDMSTSPQSTRTQKMSPQTCKTCIKQSVRDQNFVSFAFLETEKQLVCWELTIYQAWRQLTGYNVSS